MIRKPSWRSNRRSAGNIANTDIFRIGQWKSDLEQAHMECSSEVYHILGIEPVDSQLAWQTIIQCIHPEDRELVHAFWRNVVANQAAKNFKCRIVRQGTIRVIHWAVDYDYDNHGEVRSIYGSIRDVTELISGIDNFVYDIRTLDAAMAASAAMVMTDKDMCVVHCNLTAASLFGWSEQEILLKEYPLIPSSHRSAIFQLHDIILRHGGRIAFDTLCAKKDGTRIEVTLNLSAVKDEAQQVIGVCGIYQPISPDVDSGLLIVKNEAQVQALVENSSDVFVILSDDLEVRYVSPDVQNVLGYSPQEFVDTKWVNMMDEANLKEMRRLTAKLVQGVEKKIALELRIKNKVGEWRHCRATFKADRQSIQGIVMNFYDVTEQKLSRDLADYLSYHDSLTELSNRRFFEEKLEWFLQRGQKRVKRLAVLLIDIQRLKYVNDTLGHAIGDRLVKMMAQRIRSIIPAGCIISRIDGDEFGVLVPAMDRRNDAVALAQLLNREFEEPFLVEKYALHMTVSIGIDFYPEDGIDAETLIRHANLALHEAKKDGGNRVYVYTEMLNAKTYKEFSLSHQFPQALRNQEFRVYYQPRIDAKTKQIVGVEALVRWQHPDWGLLSPLDFIELAERTGNIVQFGSWVLESVCQQLGAWKQQDLPDIKVSINFSVKQLRAADVVQRVKSTLRKYAIKPRQIEIEITETHVLPSDPAIVKVLREFRKMGIRIFFDDFGTGYSSLSWLHMTELDGIKLERSFIYPLPESESSKAIVSAMIELARSLHLTVVAEGVEKLSQYDFLASLGCDEIQGYLFSEPIPSEQLGALLREGVIQTQQSSAPLPSETNRRKYFRIKVPKPMIGRLTIAQLKSKKLNIGFSEILILDIGPGGLRFVSNLRLPISPDVVLQFEVEMFGERLDIPGYVVWSHERSDGIFEYGIQFTVEEKHRDYLVGVLNQLMAALKSGRHNDGYNLYDGAPDTFFLT